MAGRSQYDRRRVEQCLTDACFADRLAAMPQGLQGLQPFGLSDKPLSIEGNISLPPRRNPAARSYRLHIDPRYLDPRH